MFATHRTSTDNTNRTIRVFYSIFKKWNLYVYIGGKKTVELYGNQYSSKIKFNTFLITIPLCFYISGICFQFFFCWGNKVFCVVLNSSAFHKRMGNEVPYPVCPDVGIKFVKLFRFDSCQFDGCNFDNFGYF